MFRKVSLAGAELLARAYGTDLSWPRTLPGPLTRAGLVDPGLHIAVGTVGDGGHTDRFWHATFAQIAPALTALALITSDEVSQLEALLTDPDFRDVSLASVSSWARRAQDA